MIDLNHYDIILASQSPRRQQLLKDMGFHFKVIVTDVDEIYPKKMPVVEIPVYLAEMKANALSHELKENSLIIAADTIVTLGDIVLGKPKDAEDAFNILRQISGRKHQVITGVCLKTATKQKSFFAESNVYFRHLSDEEIYYYISKYQPFDKAGAYGVQEWIGYVGIERIEGSYFNVMGLPTQMLYKELINL
ncbi:MAG: Maf family nucleotide pyrophosphatase [Bacteroidales bacterium]